MEEGDRVLLVSDEGDEFLVTLKREKFSTHIGTVDLGELLGKPPGVSVQTSKGIRLYALDPGYVDEVFHLKRRTQIVYPKDSGFILLMLDVREGTRVVDAGVGSGVMSHLFARVVGERGRVYAYERRKDFYERAKRNLKMWGVINRVELKLKDISEGVDERNVDAFFLDVPDPWNHIGVCWKALRGGGRLGVVVPTFNQLELVLREIEELPFKRIEVWESLMRRLKTNPDRIRPFDRMVAHTAFLVFATKVFGGDDGGFGEGKGAPSGDRELQEGPSQDTRGRA